MDKNKINIAILGAGISGLATAFWLNREGFDTTVLESRSEPGGSMITRHENGFLIDYGPNSGLETTPLIRQIVASVGLEDQMVYASETADKRYILRGGRLHALPTNPAAFLKTGLFSARAKLRLLAEPMAAKSNDGYYQSVSEFVRRRLGQEFLDYAINPFVAGVFAGNPDELSVKSAFPKLYRLEELYGGLFKGLILGARERKKRAEQSKDRAKMFSFKDGMQVLPKAIAAQLAGGVRYDCDVVKVEPSGGRFSVRYRHGASDREFLADAVLSTVPAYRAASIFGDRELARHLEEIYYPPVKVLYLGFAKSAVGRPLDGFGFLIPEKEQKAFLGAIWSSTLFPGRSNPEMAAFTLFVGGARFPAFIDEQSDALDSRVIAEFKDIMQITREPVFVKHRTWSRAIPQYRLGHIEHEQCFERFEKNNPGLFLSGNFRGGISVGDCIINSETTSKRICEHIKQRWVE